MNINTLKNRFSKKIKEMNRLRTQNRFGSFDPYTLRTDSERIEEGTQQALQRLQNFQQRYRQADGIPSRGTQGREVRRGTLKDEWLVVTKTYLSKPGVSRQIMQKYQIRDREIMPFINSS